MAAAVDAAQVIRLVAGAGGIVVIAIWKSIAHGFPKAALSVPLLCAAEEMLVPSTAVVSAEFLIAVVSAVIIPISGFSAHIVVSNELAVLASELCIDPGLCDRGRCVPMFGCS